MHQELWYNKENLQQKLGNTDMKTKKPYPEAEHSNKSLS